MQWFLTRGLAALWCCAAGGAWLPASPAGAAVEVAASEEVAEVLPGEDPEEGVGAATVPTGRMGRQERGEGGLWETRESLILNSRVSMRQDLRAIATAGEGWVPASGRQDGDDWERFLAAAVWAEAAGPASAGGGAVAVPAPGSAVLLGLGMAGLGFRRRR